VLPALDAWLSPTATWEVALGEIVTRFVLGQHQLVVLQKGRLDAAWLHKNEDRYFKDQDYDPSFRTSRHRSAVGVLTDLCLLRLDAERRLHLTGEGRGVLRRILEAG
jgi:hypothetical protein